jgi:DNA mismatch endonuclease (patch repair protein)
MADKFTSETRSKIMSEIKGENTKIEKAIFRELRKKGIYFKKHYNRLLGKPDIALPRKKKAIFIDGDFWHGYQFIKLKKRLPKKYWSEKIEKNVKRDRKNRAQLKKEGWFVLRVWGHEIEKDIEKTVNKIIAFLQKENIE